eukprot:SAG11_NODE_1227_length_5474_cov_5.294326_2_plen_61_part_00
MQDRTIAFKLCSIRTGHLVAHRSAVLESALSARSTTPSNLGTIPETFRRMEGDGISFARH